jgi:penicillin-binding protein 2
VNLSGSGAPGDGLIERRATIGVLLVIAVWGVLLSRLFYLQILQAEEYAVSAQRNSVRTHRVQAPRGTILDRNRQVLVDSRPSYEALVVPNDTENLGLTLRRLSQVLGIEAAETLERFGAPSGSARFNALRVAYDFDRDAFARLQARLWALPGVLTDVALVRSYRFGASAAHLLGWLGEIDAAQLNQRDYQGYRRGDVLGKQGIERLLDRELRGRPGGRNVEVDAHGRELRVLSRVEPQLGRNVVLTLDHRLQLAAEQALDRIGKAGAVVALDPRSGEVLVLATRPAYDPNAFAIRMDSELWEALRRDPRTPLHNRALKGVYPPGSVYKLVTAIAALEEGVVTPHTEVHCAGAYRLGRRTYRCWKKGGHGTVNVHTALVQSCDVFFYRAGQQLGVDRLAYYARALGLGAPTGIELGGESGGLVPTRKWKEKRFGEVWVDGETISLSIGQGFNLWTPIQMAAVYAAVGNGGTRYRPFVVKRLEEPDGTLVSETSPEIVGQLPFREQTLRVVRAALRGVVHEPHGTGSVMRRVTGVESAGKTGTAQVVGMEGLPEDEDLIPEQFRDHAWFVTYLPAEAPQLAIAVLVEHGGHGGSAAAPIAAEVATVFAQSNGLAPVREARAGH